MKKVKIFLGVFISLLLTLIVVPNITRADGDVFDKLLTNGKLVVHSVRPTNDGEAWAVVYENTIMVVDEKYYLDWGNSFNEDYSKCTVYYGEYNDGDPSREIDIEYVYDEDIKELVDSIVANIGDQETFNLNEIEFINYLINGSEDSSMTNYSSELKEKIGYKNFSIDVRMGDEAPFLTEKGGNALFTYDDTVYYIKERVSSRAEHIIYVDDNTTNVLEAVKARLMRNFGTDFNVTEADTIANFLDSEYQSFINDYNSVTYWQEYYESASEFATDMMNENYYKDDAAYAFILNDNVCENYYTLTINNEDYHFIAVKDSSKVKDENKLITSDINSDITISTETALIPFDTLIKVKKLTSGEEYNHILEILELENAEMFDLKLFSNSISDYITELENGTFEVKIPIPNDLKNKELVIYYVDNEDKITEYAVTNKDGYAVFNTEHFSIYTLASKEENVVEKVSKINNDNNDTLTELDNKKIFDSTDKLSIQMITDFSVFDAEDQVKITALQKSLGTKRKLVGVMFASVLNKDNIEIELDDSKGKYELFLNLAKDALKDYKKLYVARLLDEKTLKLETEQLMEYNENRKGVVLKLNNVGVYVLFDDITVDYDFLDKTDDQTYTVNSDNEIVIKIDASKDKFVALYIDSKLVDEKYYTVKEGSTIIVLKQEFLDTLSEGDHTIKVDFTDGESNGTLNIKKTATIPVVISNIINNPETGDKIITSLSIMTVSALGILFGIKYLKKKKILN